MERSGQRVRIVHLDGPVFAALAAGDDTRGFASALQRAGYATDPSYAAKITAIANSPQMREALAALQQPGALK